ncbi:Transposon Tf2-9 polyprotein [Labeo rohita]|uniref:Transposon Tf2-9 polyprotein n=1 Tax=Labeo rohita TaxID=84645 RepID=A0ABQ8L1R8_LABRO|nr:Transposon Tf2-9 polyprotein [Labeo rohita]
MEFDFTAFTLCPTTEAFNRCKKKDLILIADFFDVDIPKDVTKQVLKNNLFKKLVDAGILPKEAEDGVGVQSEVAVETAAEDLNLTTDSFAPYDPRIAVKLKEMDLLIKKQECEAEMIRLKVVEKQAERDIQLRKLDLEARRLAQKPVPSPRTRPISVSSPLTSAGSSSVTHDFSHAPSSNSFDVSKYIKLVPPFRETEVDSYFVAFERVAGKLRWPKDMWALLLQCSLSGKAQEVCSSLPIESSLDYDLVKSAVLRAYELVPEAYRQKFRTHSKTVNQTYVEFVREKRVLFEKWCLSSKITTLEDLQELILLEDFKNCIPAKIVVHLNEQKVTSSASAAVLADEFVLTHKNVFSAHTSAKPPLLNVESSVVPHVVHSSKNEMPSKGGRKFANSGERRVCFFCLDPNHMISDCKAWKQKRAASKPKNVALVQSFCNASSRSEESYQPFLFEGTVSLLPDSTPKSVTILRDTGAAQSFILADILPFSATSFTGNDVLIRGIEMHCVNVPLHTVYLKSDIVSGPVSLAVRPQLPVEGVDLILGNDLAGGTVFPRPIVSHKPCTSYKPDLAENFPSVFPACAVTRAQSKKFEKVVDLSRSFLVDDPESVECVLSITPDPDLAVPYEKLTSETPLKVGREHLAAAQKADPSLARCVMAAECATHAPGSGVVYFWEKGLLMRKWKPQREELGWQEVQQIVLPSGYRHQVLKLAHENVLSGHVGITKTYNRIVKYFFWPGLKSAVSRFCRSCHTCQLAGKPNQKIPPAPLCPIPVVSDPLSA